MGKYGEAFVSEIRLFLHKQGNHLNPGPSSTIAVAAAQRGSNLNPVPVRVGAPSGHTAAEALFSTTAFQGPSFGTSPAADYSVRPVGPPRNGRPVLHPPPYTLGVTTRPSRPGPQTWISGGPSRRRHSVISVNSGDEELNDIIE